MSPYITVIPFMPPKEADTFEPGTRDLDGPPTPPGLVAPPVTVMVTPLLRRPTTQNNT